MRYLFVALLCATTATPAMAASRDADDADIARTAQRLNDPALQSAMAGMVVAVADAFMDVRVDKLRAAIARIDPEVRDDDDRDDPRTVGDMIERDDPAFRAKMADGSRMAMGTMGAMAGSMAAMIPEMRDMADRMGRQIDKAMRRLPRE